jgi:polar amino acid transport system permease protein
VRVLDWYVALFRGTPLVVQLYFWYFALPYVEIAGVRLVLSPMWAAIIGFALCSGAYQSEYIRGGLLSIKRGQLRAAQALGLTSLQTVTSVVLPQAFRRALPGCGNEIIYLVKYSSLASIITVSDLTGMGRSLAKSTFRNTEVFVVVGLYYLALVTVATLVLRVVERKLTLPGFEEGKR